MRECCTFPLKSSLTTGEVSSTQSFWLQNAHFTCFHLRAHFSWETLTHRWLFYGLVVLGRSGSGLQPPWLALLACEGFPQTMWTWRISWPRGLSCDTVFLTPDSMHANVSDLRVGLQGEFSQRVSACGFMFFPLLFTSQVVWEKNKKLWVHFPNKPQIPFMIHCKSHLIALTDAVKSYLLIMLAFQWHQQFDHFLMNV